MKYQVSSIKFGKYNLSMSKYPKVSLKYGKYNLRYHMPIPTNVAKPTDTAGDRPAATSPSAPHSGGIVNTKGYPSRLERNLDRVR